MTLILNLKVPSRTTYAVVNLYSPIWWLISIHRTQFILLDFKSFKWESSFMAFLIVLNNKEPNFLMGLLLFFISNDNLFLQILERQKSQLLSCYLWRTNNMCCNIRWYLEKWLWNIEVGTQTQYFSKLISYNTVLHQIISFFNKDGVYLINLELKTTYFFSYKDRIYATYVS
jgi:hypothetical protein